MQATWHGLPTWCVTNDGKSHLNYNINVLASQMKLDKSHLELIIHLVCKISRYKNIFIMHMNLLLINFSFLGKDFLCVQSLDGTVSFFEQESFAFTRFLPNFLLPGPICYIPRTDSFITVSSSWQVESYKYQVLAVAQDADSKEDSQKVAVGKKITVCIDIKLERC